MTNYTVRMTNERDAGHYMVELLNIDAVQCEQTEYFPYTHDNQGAAFAKAKRFQAELASEYNAQTDN